MTSLRSTQALPVIARDTADRLGSVRSLLAEGQRFRAIWVDAATGPPRVLPWDRLAGVGDDAVMVDGADAMREPAPDDGDEQTIIGQRVLDTRGDELGTVVDVEFDAASGEISTIGLPQGEVDGKRLRGLGSYAVVVDADGPISS